MDKPCGKVPGPGTPPVDRNGLLQLRCIGGVPSTFMINEGWEKCESISRERRRYTLVQNSVRRRSWYNKPRIRWTAQYFTAVYNIKNRIGKGRVIMPQLNIVIIEPEIPKAPEISAAPARLPAPVCIWWGPWALPGRQENEAGGADYWPLLTYIRPTSAEFFEKNSVPFSDFFHQSAAHIIRYCLS